MRRAQGLSLVELLIALMVFTILGLAVTGLLVQGLKVRRQNTLTAQAQAYANLVLEAYKSHWSNPSYYDNRALPDLPAAPGVFEADRINRVDVKTFCAYLDGTTKEEAGCTDTPPLRRVQVKLIDHEGDVRAELITDIGNPRP